MLPWDWVYLILGSPLCLALTLSPEGRIKPTGNSSSDTDFRGSGFHNVTLPSTLPSRWIGGKPFSATTRGPADLNLPTRCDGSRFGRPNRKSCREAWSDMPIGTRLLNIGSRTEGAKWDVALPFRFISRQLPSQRHGNPFYHLADER